jgi:hypothetical protein
MSWAERINRRALNIGTPLVLMGAMWLYLLVGPWYEAYVHEPHWGHNYAEALAFLAVGLAYFNRRLVSDLLALLAATLIVLDAVVERGREQDLGQPAGRRLHFWLKGHLLRFALVMLGHLPLIYFVVRLPQGTYETDLVTKVYDGMVVPFILLALMEGPVQKLGRLSIAKLGFLWGMLTMIVSLALLFHQPETWICMAITLVVTLIGIVSMYAGRAAGDTSA